MNKYKTTETNGTQALQQLELKQLELVSGGRRRRRGGNATHMNISSDGNSYSQSNIREY